MAPEARRPRPGRRSDVDTDRRLNVSACRELLLPPSSKGLTRGPRNARNSSWMGARPGHTRLAHVSDPDTPDCASPRMRRLATHPSRCPKHRLSFRARLDLVCAKRQTRSLHLAKEMNRLCKVGRDRKSARLHYRDFDAPTPDENVAVAIFARIGSESHLCGGKDVLSARSTLLLWALDGVAGMSEPQHTYE